MTGLGCTQGFGPFRAVEVSGGQWMLPLQGCSWALRWPPGLSVGDSLSSQGSIHYLPRDPLPPPHPGIHCLPWDPLSAQESTVRSGTHCPFWGDKSPCGFLAETGPPWVACFCEGPLHGDLKPSLSEDSFPVRWEQYSPEATRKA